MKQNQEPPSSGLPRAVEAVLTSRSLWVGAAILVGSAVLAVSEVPGAALVVGLVGYAVAGALAPPWPFVTGLLLGLGHGAATLLIQQLADPAPPGDGLARMGADIFRLLFIGSIVIGVLVTGIVGHLARWLKAREG